MAARQTKNYETLKSEWYAKLKKAGFDDIEAADGNLKVWHHARFRATQPLTTIAAKTEYYRHAGHFLHEYKFENAVHKKMWGYHAEGLSSNAISKLLSSSKVTYPRHKVRDVIAKLANIMRSTPWRSTEE